MSGNFVGNFQKRLKAYPMQMYYFPNKYSLTIGSQYSQKYSWKTFWFYLSYKIKLDVTLD